MNKLFFSLLCISGLFMSACSSNDEPAIPTDAIPLNMSIGDSETTVGESDVYISTSLNFTSSYCSIADLGRKGGLNKNPILSQIAQEVAVTPGNFYQITLAKDIHTIAGARAYPIISSYYNVYVDSWIYDKNKEIAGAKISYAECLPETDKLPEWDGKITVKPDVDNYFYTVKYSFPKGCVIDKDVDAYFSNGYEDLTDQLKFDINGNQLVLTYPGQLTDLTPYVKLLVRYESVFTRVYLDFE